MTLSSELSENDHVDKPSKKRFQRMNIIIDRANDLLEKHRGMLPPMTWVQALAQAKKEICSPKQQTPKK